MTDFDYDLFVIGGGSGGVRAARFSAGYGAKVAIVEERHWGGTCVNVGCIPKKLFTYAAHYADDFRDAAGYGWTVGAPQFDWTTLRDNKTKEIERLEGIYGRMLENAGCTVMEGRGRIVDSHTVAVGEKTFRAKHILVAVGGWPFVPDIPGREHVITSNEAFYLDELPKRLVIVGGGYIAVEFTGIFHGLGVEVTQLYRGPHFLRGFDDDIREHLAVEMRRKGIDLRFNANVAAVRQEKGCLIACLENGVEIETDAVMYATGRKPHTRGLGLEEVGVRLDDDGTIEVDEHFRTAVPSIFALGDATGGPELTPLALAQGMAVAKTLFRDEPTTVDKALIPSAVFSQPPIATVGLTEAQARDRHGPGLDIYVQDFRPLKNTLSGSAERTLMKLIVEQATDRVLGIHMIGPDAGEIVQGLAVALKAGATKSIFDQTIGIHPTAAEEFVTMRQPVRSGSREAAE